VWVSLHESCHTCECVMTHTWIRHVQHVNESRYSSASVISKRWEHFDMRLLYEATTWHGQYVTSWHFEERLRDERVIWWEAMGRLPLVHSLKLYVSFAKEPCKRDDILKRRPIILRSVLIVATTYVTGERLRDIWKKEYVKLYEWVMSHV